MSAPVVDFNMVLRLRDNARRIAGGIGADIADLSIAWAERAFAVSGPLADIDMARAINRWGLRRAKAEVRRSLRRLVPNVDLPGVLDRVEEIYRGRMIVLEDEQAAKRGRAEGNKGLPSSPRVSEVRS